MGIAIDIDETLSWTVGAWMKLLQEEFGNPEGLTPEEMVAKYRYSQLVPYWQTPAVLARMEELRNDNKYQTTLPLIPGAIQSVWAISNLIPIYGYVTIRPYRVLTGTQEWLKKHGFPEAPVIMRPQEIGHQNGNEWKAGYLTQYSSQILGIIDDNVKLLDYLPPNYSGKIYLYSHTQVPVTRLSHVYPCPTWKEVVSAVRKNHPVPTTPIKNL